MRFWKKYFGVEKQKKALDEARRFDLGDRAELLLKDNPDLVFIKDEEGKTELHKCPYLNSVGIARILLEHGADVNANDNHGRTPLHMAANCRYCTKEMLKCGANVNARDNYGNTPLHYCEYDEEAARFLVKYGADANAKNNIGQTPYSKQEISYDRSEPGYNGGYEAVRDFLRNCKNSKANAVDK